MFDKTMNKINRSIQHEDLDDDEEGVFLSSAQQLVHKPQELNITQATFAVLGLSKVDCKRLTL
jgi:hypothetical protein